MPELWSHTVGDEQYRVVRAGHSLRLYTNGVLHSQYNPNQVVSGALWDLLLVPAFMYPGLLKKALVLGVGGGAVINMLRYFWHQLAVVGVDNNAVHLEVAQQFFGVNGAEVGLHYADARDWLASHGDDQYDYVLDDIFGGKNGDPQRPFAFDAQWLHSLCQRLAPNGVLAINFDRAQQAYQLIDTLADAMAELKIQRGWILENPSYCNGVLVLSKASVEMASAVERMQTHRILDSRLRSCRLNYRATRCI
ncbi:hypothetical protein [Halioxenophilus aromaticivorans]|uniref:Spermidine synthase n=1 Tax=Halioxenophilus aromaticivorans TaxID=1306992 RepID=A0AAV3UAI0_9ALTE